MKQRLARRLRHLAEWLDDRLGEPEFLHQSGDVEVWKAGSRMFAIPTIREGIPPILANLIALARLVGINGRCIVCGLGPELLDGKVEMIPHPEECPLSCASINRAAHVVGVSYFEEAL